MSSWKFEKIQALMSQRFSIAREAVKGWVGPNQEKARFLVMLVLGIVLVAFYGFSKNESRPASKILVSRDSEFTKSRILGDPYATSSKAKEQILERTAKQYADSEKAVSDRLLQMNSRLDAMEQRVGATGSSESKSLSIPSENDVQDLDVGVAQGIPQAMGQGSEPLAGEPRLNSTTTADVSTEDRRISLYPNFRQSGAVYQKMEVQKGPAIVSFPVEAQTHREKSEVVLPVGSYVKAKLLTGVEVPEGTPYPVLLQLDFANILPNSKALDLSGCFMIAKAQGDLSIERVQMQATKLSCVARDGKMFERDINGFVADAADNSFAVVGTVNSKQDRVAAMAFLSSVVAGVGQAIQMAQTTENTSPDGVAHRQMTGDQGKYIAGGGAGQAAGMVAQWYLKQAQNLLPTINVGSGQDVWVILNETVALPKEYFKKAELGEKYGKDYAIVNHLFD